MTSAYRRLGRVSVLVAAAAVSLAACSSGSNSPQVASLGSSGPSSGSTSSAPAQPTGNPTQLLDEWATCMRSHGFPTLTDPTVDANKVIHIIVPPGINGNATQVYQKSSAYGPCNPYLTGAQTALRGGASLPKPDPVKLEKFSQCMRANGIHDFPDPTGNGIQIQSSPGSDLNPNNPTFQNAQKKCANQVGLPRLAGGTPPPGSVQIQQQVTNGGPAGGGAANGG
jgi:hypothetical protein